jgi:hypothetical protein
MLGHSSTPVAGARLTFLGNAWISRARSHSSRWVQNGVEQVFRLVAEACAGLPIQPVISLGGGLSEESLGALPGSPLVVRYAPQLELLKLAALTIFHGGLNTALESLAHGVPMVALPVTIDQPGVGARIKRTHTGNVNPGPAPLDALSARGNHRGLEGSKLPAKRPALSTPNRSGERR